MNSKQRLSAALRLQKPDCVPVTPDTSVMIPCRMVGKPWWDVLLYQDPPLWRAYLDVVKRFDFDGWSPFWWIDGLDTELLGGDGRSVTEECIIHRTEERIYTRRRTEGPEGVRWSDDTIVYYIDQPMSLLSARTMGLPDVPDSFEVVRKNYDRTGLALYRDWVEEMGDRGIVGVPVGCVGTNWTEEAILEWYDDPTTVLARSRAQSEHVLAFTKAAVRITPKPDMIQTGTSGWLTFQSPEMFEAISFANLRDVTAVAKAAGIPSQVHCCGREAYLVEVAATRTDLSCIEPLETAPMGDCDLADLKRRFGRRICLKGNLHTTDVMLRGTVAQVREAAKRAIDDAAEGGGFILSTGDQVPRDTPYANLEAMVDVARTYGRYA
jgi:uroporphyrinogen decarboxylase